ncbi:hypothetical protein EOM86_10825 [Candidatus Nomurabacteria bacterium]|nr:hypothetical protein [Candidatus Nomurabacteria bacterium]
MRYDEYVLSTGNRYRGAQRQIFNRIFEYNAVNKDNQNNLNKLTSDPYTLFRANDGDDLPKCPWVIDVIDLCKTGIPADPFNIGFSELMRMDLYTFEIFSDQVKNYMELKESARLKAESEEKARQQASAAKKNKGNNNGPVPAFLP